MLGVPPDDLPLADDLTISEAWTQVFQESPCEGGFDHAPAQCLRVVGSSDPRAENSAADSPWETVVEPRSPRGPAGAVADVVHSTGRGEALGTWLVVIEASANPGVELAGLFRAAAEEPDASLILGASDLDRPCGVNLVRRDIYDQVPTTGFFDFKEQLLSKVLEDSRKVRAVVVAKRAYRIDTRKGWLAIVDAWMKAHPSRGESRKGPWRLREGACAIGSQSMVEDASIISSVVMNDAVVESGAVVARSIVGPGAVVPSGAVLVDAVLPGATSATEVGRRGRRSQLDWTGREGSG